MLQLLTIDDIAKRFRTSRRNVAERWVRQPDFPAPRFAPTKRTRLWNAADIEQWASPKHKPPPPSGFGLVDSRNGACLCHD